MNPDEVVKILVALNVAGGVAALWHWFRTQREQGSVRRYTDADQVRAVLEEAREQDQRRLTDLEHSQAEINAGKDLEIKELKAEVIQGRADVAACRREHAEARVLNATLTERLNAMVEVMATNTDQIANLKQQLVNRGYLDNRRDGTHHEGPPMGLRERRTPEGDDV